MFLSFCIIKCLFCRRWRRRRDNRFGGDVDPASGEDAVLTVRGNNKEPAFLSLRADVVPAYQGAQVPQVGCDLAPKNIYTTLICRTKVTYNMVNTKLASINNVNVVQSRVKYGHVYHFH